MPAFISTMDAGRQTLVVNAPVTEVYRQWSRLEDLPKFIKTLQTVQRVDDTHFLANWVHDGRENQQMLHVVLRIPGRRIAWRTLSGGFWLVVVTFEPFSSQATEVTLKMSSDADFITLSKRLTEYLANFKDLIENRQATAA